MRWPIAATWTRNRFGLWGVNLGAYVALAEATDDRRVRAVAVESPYDHPKDMVALQVSRVGTWIASLRHQHGHRLDFWLA